MYIYNSGKQIGASPKWSKFKQGLKKSINTCIRTALLTISLSIGVIASF